MTLIQFESHPIVANDRLFQIKDGRRKTITIRSKDLSDREIQVLDLLHEGKGNKEIARILDITMSTVKNHIVNIRQKLGAKNRAEAVYKYFVKRNDKVKLKVA